MAERKPLAHPVPSGQNGCKSVFYLFDVGDQEVDEEDGIILDDQNDNRIASDT